MDMYDADSHVSTTYGAAWLADHHHSIPDRFLDDYCTLRILLVVVVVVETGPTPI